MTGFTGALKDGEILPKCVTIDLAELLVSKRSVSLCTDLRKLSKKCVTTSVTNLSQEISPDVLCVGYTNIS